MSGETKKGIPYVYKYPDPEEITAEQIKYIDNFFNEVEDEAYKGIVDKIDHESFINFITITEMAATTGAVWSNYLYKEREDDLLYFGPVWDYDNSFGDDYRADPIENFTNFNFKYFHQAGTMKNFVTKILNNEKLLKEFKENWEKISGSNIRQDLMDFIDEKYKKIKQSARLNFLRWDILRRKVGFNPAAKCTFDGEIKYLKDWVLLRIDLLDGIFERASLDTINEEIHTVSEWGGSGFNFNWTTGNHTGGWGGWGGFGGNGTTGGNWGGFGGNGTTTFPGGNWGGFGGNGTTTFPGGNHGGFGGNGTTGGNWGGFNWGNYSRGNGSHHHSGGGFGSFGSLGSFDETCLTPEMMSLEDYMMDE